MIRRLLISFFLIIVASLHSDAVSRFQFTYYIKERGLPRTLVQDMIQDNNGCLWLASWSGLYRFDGMSFTGFRADNLGVESEKANNRFDRIERDSFGQLWVLSYDGTLYRFDPRTESFRHIDRGRDINQIYKLSSDDFCFITSDNTVLRTKYSEAGQSCSLYEYCAVAASDNINAIYKDAEDNIWTATDRAIMRNKQIVSENPGYCIEFSSGALRFGSRNGLIVECIDGRIFELPTGAGYDISLITNIPGTIDLLLGSDDGRLSHLNMDKWKLQPVSVPRGCHLDSKPQTFTARDGTVWIWSTQGGIAFYEPGISRLEPLLYELRAPEGWNAENNILKAMIDGQDNIWFSGSWGGAGRASRKDSSFKLLSFEKDNSSPSPANSVRAIFQSHDGVIYAGTKNSRVHLLGDGFTPMTTWTIPFPAYSIAEDRQGHIWIGTKGGGIIENTAPDISSHPAFRPRTYRKSNGSDDKYGSNGDLVYCLLQDSGTRLWTGSFDGGVSYIETAGGGRRFISSRNEIPVQKSQIDKIRYLTFSPDGRLYACGRKGAFVCPAPYDEPGRIRFERYPDTKEYDIQHILFTKDGTMYASSFGNGLLRSSTDGSLETEAFTTEDGLMSNFVFSSIEDKKGDIWISTYRGLNKYSPATGDIIGWSYDRIGKDLLLNEGEPLMTKDGELMFNTTAGILHFDPDEVSNSSYIPKVFLLHCQYAGARIYPEPGKAIEVRGNGSLRIRFGAVDMNGPERVMYSWKMNGEDNWTQLGNTAVITLDNLATGRHELLLRATNSDGVQADNSLKVTVIVRPEISSYLQLGTCLAILCLAAAFLTIKRRKNRLTAENTTVPATIVTEPAMPLSGDDLKFKRAFVSLLEENLDNGDLSAEDMAEALNVSRSALFEKCRTLLGKAPTEYLRDLRFSRAAEMIAKGGYSISQIAYKTGFNDSHYFSKAFRKRFGMSPSEYRKSLKDS